MVASPALTWTAQALRRLLADIEAGLIDVIVVYKIDRLSRALMDFAKLVEVFDAHGVTFVSVTQSFNTTTSMGRLTLNILLSFAQFEREVIGERIRDKFAASRARGMWMGGRVPLGYDVRDRKLVVNEAEAAVVRRVFEGFVDLGSGTALAKVLQDEGVTSKTGRLLNKGDVYKLLNNPTYVGEAAHKGQILCRGARRHRRPAAVGPGACHAPGEPAGSCQQEPEPVSGHAEGADLRRGRAGTVADTHATWWTAVSLLRGPAGAARRRRPRTGWSDECRQRRSSGPSWTRCGRCYGSPRSSWAPGWRHGPKCLG